MRHLVLMTGAIALAAAAPAYAHPGNGHGNPHGYGHGYGAAGTLGYGVGGCPPGLRNKGCMPPGQAKKLFHRGERYDLQYGSRYSFGQIPYDIRRQYDLNARYR